jgi:hypothetical protein
VTRVWIGLGLLLLVWLVAGRQITLLFDRALPWSATSLPVTPLKYDGGGFVVGQFSMLFGSLDNQRFDLRVTTDAANRGVLTTAQGAFTLGPRTNPIDSSGRPEIDFVPDPGDALSFTVRHSLINWPTPFDIRIIGGPAPWWKRYVYYRLFWKKRSGASLEMLWRYEQQYISGRGWSAPAMMWNWQTGLLWVKIRPEAGGRDAAVVEYIGRTKGWPRDDYRIESRGPSSVAVIHVEDERGLQPGAGRSLELSLDPVTHQITKEVSGQ